MKLPKVLWQIIPHKHNDANLRYIGRMSVVFGGHEIYECVLCGEEEIV